MLIADRQPIIEVSHEINQLIIRQSKTILHCPQQNINDDLKGLCKCDIRQFIDHKKEEFTDRPIIGIPSLLQRQEHIADKDQRHMCSQCVI